jgi:predicted negative regulator of RcsB-dependent stress response
MSKFKNSSGFAALEGVLILVIVAIVAFAGYKVEQARNNTNKLNQESAAQQVAVPKATASATVPATVNSASDLDKAASALNSDNPDDNSADITRLNSQSNF